MFIPQTNLLLIAIISTISLHELERISTQADEVKTKSNSLWSEMKKLANVLFKKCDIKGHNHRKDNAGAILENCLKRRGLRALDRALSRDVIAISDNIIIVKWKNDTGADDEIGVNDRSQKKLKTSKSLEIIKDWYNQLMEKVLLFVKTRVLKISFKGLNGLLSKSEARHRDKNNSFGQMMMFGLVAAGFIVIPLGFQFLAVLGGKALLLAKLALLLSSIQGLKKIATSHVNYGLYSTAHGGPWHYDRKWHFDGDHYPATYYSSALDSPVSDHYVQSSDLSSVYNPRLEKSYS